MLQMGICKVIIINKGIGFWYNFCSAKKWPACESLQLLSIIWDPTSADLHGRLINEKTRQGKSKTNKNSKINLHYKNKIKQNIDYFIAGWYKEANMAASVKATQELYNKYSDIFTGIGCFKGTFSLLVKEGAKQQQVQMCSICPRRTIKKRIRKIARTTNYIPIIVHNSK